MTSKSAQVEAKKLERILRSGDVVRDILHLCAVAESRLDNFLAIEFAGPARYDEFVDLIVPSLSLPQKVRILKKMKFHRPMKSIANIAETIERLRNIRNRVAHSWYLSQKEIQEIRSDRKLVAFLLDYPQSFSREKHLLEVSTSRLWASWQSRNHKRSANVAN